MWVIYTLICALALATGDALTKRALRGTDESLVAWLRLVVTALPMLVILALIERPEIGPDFYKALAWALPLEVLATFLYVRALRVSPMSLSIPFLAFTPVFLIFVGYLILGERPSAYGVVGIVLITSGGYILNLGHARRGWLEPFRAILMEPGSMMMLGVAFIYSFTASLVKLAITNSSPLYAGALYFIMIPLGYLPLAAVSIRRLSIGRRELSALILAGLCMALSGAMHMIAAALTHVAYMISVKRTSLLFGVLYGCLLFREGNLGERTAGAALMLLGFVVIVTLG